MLARCHWMIGWCGLRIREVRTAPITDCTSLSCPPTWTDCTKLSVQCASDQHPAPHVFTAEVRVTTAYII